MNIFAIERFVIWISLLRPHSVDKRSDERGTKMRVIKKVMKKLNANLFVSVCEFRLNS